MAAADFTRRVLHAVRRIPAGRVATYGDVAARAGRPRAWRAVGNILRECHDPGTPCHRVVGAGGALGGYGGNLHLKRALLRREGIDVGERRIRRFADVRLAAIGLLLIAAASAGCERRSAAAQTGDPSIRAEALMQVVTELSSPRYGGRLAGSEGGQAARRFVTQAFRAGGLRPAAGDRFEHPFAVDGRMGANVLGRVSGTEPAAGIFVVSAHYDHRGVRDGRLQPGADDNASGVAALIALAHQVVARPLRHDVVFAAFDAEEIGLAGSRAFVADPPVPRARIVLNLNLDMLSRSDRREIFAAGTSHTPWLRPLVEDVQRRAAVTIRFGHDGPAADGTRTDDWTLQSDHAPFHLAGIPFLYYGVESHPDYHQPTDTADKIDPAFFRDVVVMVHDTLRTFDRGIGTAAAGPFRALNAPPVRSTGQ